MRWDSFVKKYVCWQEVDTAAPVNEVLPVHVSRPLVDNSSTHSQTLSSLLGITQLTVIELLKDIVFPDIECE